LRERKREPLPNSTLFHRRRGYLGQVRRRFASVFVTLRRDKAGATSLPVISSKTFIRLLPPSGIRRDESAAVALWRDKQEKYEHTVKHAGHLPD
jgi:hypothetical protein